MSQETKSLHETDSTEAPEGRGRRKLAAASRGVAVSLLGAVLFTGFGLAGCADEDPIDEAIEEVKDETDDAKDELEEAKDEVSDEIDDHS